MTVKALCGYDKIWFDWFHSIFVYFVLYYSYYFMYIQESNFFVIINKIVLLLHYLNNKLLSFVFHVGISVASIAEKYATRYLQSQNDTKMNVFHGIYLYLPLNHQINYSPPWVKFVNIINFTSKIIHRSNNQVF